MRWNLHFRQPHGEWTTYVKDLLIPPPSAVVGYTEYKLTKSEYGHAYYKPFRTLPM